MTLRKFLISGGTKGSWTLWLQGRKTECRVQHHKSRKEEDQSLPDDQTQGQVKDKAIVQGQTDCPAQSSYKAKENEIIHCI